MMAQSFWKRKNRKRNKLQLVCSSEGVGGYMAKGEEARQQGMANVADACDRVISK